MKNIATIIALPLLLSACLGYKELPVEYDYSYQATFKKYRTFDIMTPVGSKDSTMVNSVIKKSIIARMKFLGYRQVTNKPHLIIGFKMFNDTLRFQGYMQPEIEDWVRTEKADLAYSPQKFRMNKGTLLIHFYDRRQNRSIWQGYATTMYGSIDFQNSRHLKNAVISILDKYRFWAEGFLDNERTLAHEKDL